MSKEILQKAMDILEDRDLSAIQANIEVWYLLRDYLSPTYGCGCPKSAPLPERCPHVEES